MKLIYACIWTGNFGKLSKCSMVQVNALTIFIVSFTSVLCMIKMVMYNTKRMIMKYTQVCHTKHMLQITGTKHHKLHG